MSAEKKQNLQDTFLNMVGDDAVATAYLWDCASAYNLRSMTYRREAILDALAKASPTLLEPIAKLTITAPTVTLGDIAGDLAAGY